VDEAITDPTTTDACTKLGVAGGMILEMAPELGRWLFGKQAEAVVGLVQTALERVTGSNDPSVQATLLSNPVAAAALRMELARITACQADNAAQAQTSMLTLPGNEAASSNAQRGEHVASGAALVSIVVLLTFAIVIVVAFTRPMTAGLEPVLNVLLGTLGAMSTSVVGYWVGSSAGSARKDERLANIAERS
jgi:hypothetical protein